MSKADNPFDYFTLPNLVSKFSGNSLLFGYSLQF